MEINNLEKNQNINLSHEFVNERIQKNFLQTMLGKTIDTAMDIGIRTLLPEFVEDQVINIKNNLLNYGLKEGISRTINDAIDLGKSTMGIITGNFENVSQMKSAIQSGGIIDGISSVLDVVVDKVKKSGMINNTVAKTIKQGKNAILDNIERNIESMFEKQFKSIQNANKYIQQWKNCLNEKNFNGMEKEYSKLKKEAQIIAPIEKTINDIKSVEVIHNFIKNNGQNFNLTKEQLELADKLK